MAKVFTDQMQREVRLEVFPPRRIVSLVPSQTELLFDLGLTQEVVGITKFCIHPREQWERVPKVGGTKLLHFDRIHQLAPDLIIGNREENTKDQILELARFFPVWLSDISGLDDALEMILAVGRLTGKAAEAAGRQARIAEAFARIPPPPRLLRVAYLIWRQPYMAVGADTFIHEMLERAGLQNVFAHLERYPEISLEQLAGQAPDLILLSSEPYPFQEKHFAEFAGVLPPERIFLVDGERFSWYGSRLLASPPYFMELRRQFFAAI